jgi:hypothetical protein
VAGVIAPDVHPSYDSATKLFVLRSTSWWRRKPRKLCVKNMQDVVIFRLRHNISYWRETFGKGCKRQIEIPEGKGYRSVGSSDSTKSKTWSTGIDLNIENLVADGRPVIIHISQPRTDLDSYDVTVDGAVVAGATRFKEEPQSKFSS